jgi:hypothetical protein
MSLIVLADDAFISIYMKKRMWSLGEHHVMRTMTVPAKYYHCFSKSNNSFLRGEHPRNEHFYVMAYGYKNCS